MDLTALRSFHEVCRQGSISAAAQALGYTQSAVSRQLATLETALRGPLLRRHARGVQPTAAGEALLVHAAAILARVEQAAEEVAAARTRQPGRLRVGAVPTAVGHLLPRALTAYAATDPGIRVSFAEGVTPRLLPRLRDGKLDLVVVTDYPPGLPVLDGVRVLHLLDDRLHLAVARTHRLAGTGPVDLAELADEAWVEDYAGAAAILTSACGRAGFTPRVEIETGGWMGKLAFVAAGFGVCLVPGLLVPAVRVDITICELRDPPVRAVYAALRDREADSGPAARFAAALAEAAFA
ncbi:LysR family transcriptional regulator [Catellatospora sp. KI3]|uniref:LysR family transcriptional regulator n=1 Tax=Catellatospora sp. KI3 TaxID=3041620 RepID=UPI00248224F5|nr:LysR family transcriptional regulator [Catellatospora sp. KI3]MDI1462710.1 LysR family transcriptional regulator [Catellatospora sp. KI3]